ncbi:MAG: hypothetical protein COB36_11695 [Alphaproteobacteria bacterium]|nr:MAG: hypothetical protein COB36_11695 [Alphaproteobacteria bacterium]
MKANYEWIGAGVNTLYSLTAIFVDGVQYLSADQEVYPETEYVVGCLGCMDCRGNGDYGKGHSPAFLCGAGHPPYDGDANYYCQQCAINHGIFEPLSKFIEAHGITVEGK